MTEDAHEQTQTHIVVVHDEQGRIVSLSRTTIVDEIENAPRSGAAPLMGQTVTHVELNNELRDLPLAEIHRHFELHFTDEASTLRRR